MPLLLPVCVGLLACTPAAAREFEQRVDLALVLAVDVSGSVDAERYDLQRRGYADAFASQEVIDAVASGSHKAIAVTLVEWSGTDHQKQMIGWTIIDGPDAARGFSAAVVHAQRAYADQTAIGEAIDFAAALLRGSGYDAPRNVIDVSGDGPTNVGRYTPPARDEAVASGITINGLPILTEDPLLDRYYHDNVIGGDGAFVVVARDFGDFGSAIRNKLVREIADVDGPGASSLAAASLPP